MTRVWQSSWVKKGFLMRAAFIKNALLFAAFIKKPFLIQLDGQTRVIKQIPCHLFIFNK